MQLRLICALFLLIMVITPMQAAEIHQAAKNGDLALIKKLLEKDPKLLDSGNMLQQSPLLIASYQGHEEIIAFLLEKKADVNKKDKFGATALHMASLKGNVAIVKLLLSHGADINIASNNGKVPMQMAFEAEQTEVVGELLKKGIDVNAPIDQFNRTLLHKAAIMGKSKVLGFLMEKGGDINKQDNTQRTPLDLARACGHADVIAFLSKNKAVGKVLDELVVTYLANEGFVISAGIQGILIDGLFKFGFGNYLIPSKEIIRLMQLKEKPLHTVKFVLFTHNHADHFDVSMTETFLQNSSNAILIAPRQVALDMELYGLSYNSLKHRMISAAPQINSAAALSVKDLKMNVLRLQHGNPEIQNLGFIIDLAGHAIFHMGDATFKENAEVFKKTALNKYRFKVAFIPYFEFTTKDGRRLIKEHINAENIVLMHVPPADLDKIEKLIDENRNDFPNLMVFKKALESKTFN